MQNRIPTQHFAAHPLAVLAPAFALGILGALFCEVSLPLLITVAAFITLLALMLSLKHAMSIAPVVVTFAMLLAGASLAVIEKTSLPAKQLRLLLSEGAVRIGEPVEVTGVLEREPEIAPARIYLNLRVERIRVREVERESSGVLTLLAATPVESKEAFDQLDLCYGARIRVMTTLDRSDRFRNPGVSLFTEYLDRKGYDASGFVKSPLLIERLENERVILPMAWLYEWRRKLQAEIDSRFSTETAGVLNAALLGNRYSLSRSASEKFREGGTFHVLVISGLHITFLGGLVFLIARWFTNNKVVQFLLSVTVLWAYALAVGAESSVVRAALMFTVVLLAPLLARKASSLNALGGVAIALLVWRPSDLLDPSFQLTFLSVLAIVVYAWPLLQKLSEVGSWRPTRETPYPPSCAPWLRSFCESLFWSERQARVELERTNYTYRLFKNPWAERLERMHLQRAMRYAFGAIVVSFCVQLTLLPFLVIYFHRLSLASFFLNIGVSLLMAGVAIAAVAGLAVAQLSSELAAPLIRFADALNWLMVHSVDPFEKVGAASIRLPEYTGWAAAIYGLYYLPLAMLAGLLSHWAPLNLRESESKTTSRRTLRFFTNPLRSLRLEKDKSAEDAKTPSKDTKSFARHLKSLFGTRGITRLALLLQLLAVAVIVIHPFSAGRPTGKLRIDFLDVGQGDSALVTLPDNTTLLIDGGGKPGPFKQNRKSQETDGAEDENFERETLSIGESVVSEYLWWRGLDHIDYILASHADADHIDGLNDVARNFEVRAALVARTPSLDPEYSQFLKTLNSRGIPVRLIGAGDEMRVGDVSALVLWPKPSASLNIPSGNNDSLVLQLKFGDRSILLTADIEAPAESAIVKTRYDLRADVVKVAHHGSKTSSTESFIGATHPSFAVVSVGQTSIFGHPNADVVERWRASGAQVLTTGASGTITFSTDGSNLTLGTFIKDK